MSQPFVDVRELHENFSGQKAVNGVSFVIDKGECFGLLGPNGAGKTTTIRMLSTVLPPDAGDAVIGGFSLKNQPEKVREIIGVCPQDLALYEEMSALDNLVFFGRMAGLDGKEAREQAAFNLDLMELSERAKDKVQKYSGGMKRRINLAIALMGHPQLLFLDEPTVGIDPQSRNKIFETIQNLQKKGMAVLYTTHYMEEADHLCERVAIMDGGQVIAMDSPRELKTKIGNPDVVTLEDVFLNLTGRSLRD
jgi:ABC-2 type transport system ATP-binding protein